MKTKRKTTLKKKIRGRVPQIKVYKKNRAYHLKIDKGLTAKKVGERKSDDGKTYWERRENRSDVSRKKRL